MDEGNATVDTNAASVEKPPSTNNLSFMWRMLLGGIRKSFPSARQLQTEELQQWISDQEKENTLLMLDVREKDEFTVGTIPGAFNVKPDATDIDRVLDSIKGQKDVIVCFCSVGYRSAKMAEMIQKKYSPECGGQKFVVYNLEGSLFKWANEGREMVNIHGNKTGFCHPYSVVWGKFLDSDKRKWEVESSTTAL